MTFSIAARCRRTRQLGIAVSTADPGAGRLVTWVRPRVGAVAMQSWPSPYTAIDALQLMSEGRSASEALAEVVRRDPGSGLRQIGVVDDNGASAAWSGDECTTWYGHVTGADFSVQGNMLVSGDTVSAMAETFQASNREDLAERLLLALEAGQQAGGDKRGRQCSALYVTDCEIYPLWDLRVDDHSEPVAELRRIFEIARHQMLPFVQGLPTRQNPEGSLSEDFIRMSLLPPPQRRGGGGSGPRVCPHGKDREE